MAATLPRFPAFIPLGVVAPSATVSARRGSDGASTGGATPGPSPSVASGVSGVSADTRPRGVPLTQLPLGARGVVTGVRLPDDPAGGRPDAALERMALRLIEIGFVEGEALQVVAFGQPGHDPIGVRIGGRGGHSRFALRRVEAGCVWVDVDGQGPDGRPSRGA